VVAFIAEVGCRPSEAINLDWSEVRLDEGVCILRRHKTAKATGKTRKVWLTPAAADILRDTRADIVGDIVGAVFLTKLKKPYTRAGLRSIVTRHAQALGLRVRSLYGLRHARAQSILEDGGSLEMVASQLGHASIVMSQRYAQVRDDQSRKIAASLVAITRPAPDADMPTPAPSKSKSKGRAKRPPTRRKRASRKTA